MHAYDFSPLFRSTIGFDRISRQMETARQADGNVQTYPPYNIEKSAEDAYRITLAVAGFREEELDITVTDNELEVTGRTRDADEANGGDQRRYLHHGIAGRAFQRRFELADHIRVASAKLENGLLHVELAREVPEALKPRTIPINSGTERIAAH